MSNRSFTIRCINPHTKTSLLLRLFLRIKVKMWQYEFLVTSAILWVVVVLILYSGRRGRIRLLAGH